MLITAPVTSRSGYGSHARDLVWSFIQHDKYDVKILDVRWGDTPKNALDKDNPKDKQILDCILLKPEMDRQPDIYVDIRIPNEFEQVGKFNIGITAGTETTAVSPEWIDSCNKMDLIIVPSEHSKKSFVNTVYDRIENEHKTGDLNLQKPIEVLFEGVDENIFKPVDVSEYENDIINEIDNIEENFCYLFVGQWTKSDFGIDRKDISRMIKVFYESFANKSKQPVLILKTNGATFSILDKKQIKDNIEGIKNMFPDDIQLPKIYLIHGDLSQEQMNLMYNHPKIKYLINFTHGEGFGRPMLEATMTGLPVIASGWSGHLDFLDFEFSTLVKGTLNQIPKKAVWDKILIKESQWFTVDENDAYKALQRTFKQKFDNKNKAKKLLEINKNKFKLDDMTIELKNILDKHVTTFSELKLPKLKKINKPDKIKLPKLKKVKS